MRSVPLRASPAAPDPDESPHAPQTSNSPARSDAAALDFARLVRTELDFVWRALRRVGLSPADADDAAQQVFLVASRRMPEVTPGKQRSFLYGTALRVASNVRRGLSRRRETPSGLSELGEALAEEPAADELVERREACALLDSLLAELPEELARVLVLAEVEQLTLAAIGELEGIPQGTAASRLRRARALFRELLEAHRDQNPFEHPFERRGA